MAGKENGPIPDQLEEESKILELQDLTADKRASMVSQKGTTAKVTLAHALGKEEPLFGKLEARLDSRNHAQQRMQHGDDNVIEVSSAKRANAKNLSGESDSQH